MNTQSKNSHEEDDKTKDLALKCYLHSHEKAWNYCTNLPEPLNQSFLEIYEEWQQLLEPGGGENLFLGPLGTPAFQLTAFVAESFLPEPDSPPLYMAGEAMLTAYFAYRCQDDIVDEEAPRERVYLQEALMMRSAALMSEVSEHPAVMLHHLNKISTDFAAVAMADTRLRVNHDTVWEADALELQKRKFLPMLGPLAALLIRAGKESEIANLRECIETMTLGLQLTNDWRGAHRDLATGQSSSYLSSLGLKPGLHTEADLIPGIRRAMRTGAYGQYMDSIYEALESSTKSVAHFSSFRLGEHIENRKQTLVAKSDEASTRALLTSRPLMLDIEVTRKCNLDCKPCFVHVLDQAEGIEEQHELSFEIVEEILEEASGYMTRIHLTGGEPFVWPHIWSLFDKASEVGLDDIVINTNGTLLTDEVLDRMGQTDLTFELLVSVDGPPHLAHCFRGQEANELAIRAINSANNRGIKAHPASAMSKELVNYGLDTWFDYLSERINRDISICFWPFTSVDQSCNGLNKTSSGDLQKAAVQISELIKSGKNITVADFPVINPLLKRLGVEESKLWQCRAGVSRLSVQADLTITPCHPYRLELGKIERGKIGGVISRTLLHEKSLKMSQRDYEGCRDCEEKSICGNCQAVVTSTGLPLFSNDWFCREVLARKAA